MKLQDVKKAILDKSIEDNFLVFLCAENYFIADQYVEAIATTKNYNLQYINSLTETESTAALIQENAEILYVLKTEVFEEVFEREVVLTDEMTAEDVEGWDSLQNIILISALQDKFDVKFSVGDVRNFKCVGDIISYLSKK